MPVSQVKVGCPWARGLQLQWHPKAEEHPQAYQPATQPRALKATTNIQDLFNIVWTMEN